MTPVPSTAASSLSPPAGHPPVGDAGARTCDGVFPSGAEITEAATGGGKRRFEVFDPTRDATWKLGETELTTARLFDGRRTYEEIRQVLVSEHRLRPSPEKLVAFERRLLDAGLLESTSQQPTRPKDPFTGMNYGWLHHLVVIPLYAFDPRPALDWMLRRAPWMARRAGLVLALLVTALGIAAVAVRWHDFAAGVSAVVAGWGWLWLFVIVGLSSFFHEGGHVLSCEAYGVRSREIGLALLFLVPTAWTRPEQRQWSALSRGRRIATIWAGPLGSLFFGALGALLWWPSPPGSVAYHVGILMVIAALFGTLPTLCPIFNGDAYLLLTEYFRLDGLRTKSFTYLRQVMTGKAGNGPELAPRRKALYLAVSVGTLVGWVATWALLIWLITFIGARETARLAG